VADRLSGGRLSAVAPAEVIGTPAGRGGSRERARAQFGTLPLETAAFDRARAMEPGFLRPLARRPGRSPGDRACRALARAEGARVPTAVRSRAGRDVGADIEVSR
jgi:PIN domain nuclease of toxin-antitoxin system